MELVTISPNPNAPEGNIRKVEYLRLIDNDNGLDKCLSLDYTVYTYESEAPNAIELYEIRKTSTLETESEEEYKAYWEMILTSGQTKQEMFKKIVSIADKKGRFNPKHLKK
jgi:hypothetical protein